jgi:hypothetical protein
MKGEVAGRLDIFQEQTGIRVSLTQSDLGVPSSHAWNPTKPFMTMHQYSAPSAPAYTAVNHYDRQQVYGTHLRGIKLT